MQSIPAYLMNLFRLPKSLIRDLHRLFSRFWWGSTTSSSKIHWCKWETLCKSKAQGGLGFKDLECFNQAMLAKQCWRLISHPSSLAGRVLKSIYFPHGSFLDAATGSSPSFVWRSLLWGRDLVDLGSRWRIGNGASTRIYGDRWIPSPSTFKVYSLITLAPSAVVAVLKSPSGGWNSNLIWSSFLLDEANLILNIPCCSTPHHDTLMWHFSKADLYSVKSGYWVAMSHKHCFPSCSVTSGSSVWQLLWGVKLPSKIKIFLWRGLNNWLPSFATLRNRHIEVMALCPCCKTDAESILHAVWSCS
ncbi:hypothetical protein ACOSQ4_033437 [Xanthoceras sorbifolium]